MSVYRTIGPLVKMCLFQSDSVNDVVASTSKDSPSKSKKNKKKDKLVGDSAPLGENSL